MYNHVYIYSYIYINTYIHKGYHIETVQLISSTKRYKMMPFVVSPLFARHMHQTCMVVLVLRQRIQGWREVWGVAKDAPTILDGASWFAEDWHVTIDDTMFFSTFTFPVAISWCVCVPVCRQLWMCNRVLIYIYIHTHTYVYKDIFRIHPFMDMSFEDHSNLIMVSKLHFFKLISHFLVKIHVLKEQQNTFVWPVLVKSLKRHAEGKQNQNKLKHLFCESTQVFAMPCRFIPLSIHRSCCNTCHHSLSFPHDSGWWMPLFVGPCLSHMGLSENWFPKDLRIYSNCN